MSLKNPVTRPGIDPGTVRLVAQRLNHYATCVYVQKFNIDVVFKVNTLRLAERLLRICEELSCVNHKNLP
jgi:Holliday junction resolvasome RuvABC endonuclease subunit